MLQEVTRESTGPPPEFLWGHWRDLQGSGFSKESIRACKFRTVRHPEEVLDILNWPPAWLALADSLGPCLEIPFFGLARQLELSCFMSRCRDLQDEQDEYGNYRYAAW